jgi:hypothetical protein
MVEILQAMYDLAQEILPGSITLYRAESHEESNVLASWTSERSIAEMYLEWYEGSYMVSRTFNKSEILSFFGTGLGVINSQEYIVIA